MAISDERLDNVISVEGSEARLTRMSWQPILAAAVLGVVSWSAVVVAVF